MMKRKFYTCLMLLSLAACAAENSVVENKPVVAVKSKPVFLGNRKVDTYVDVFISNGKSQCVNDGQAINVSKRVLTEADIHVKQQSCGLLSGVMYPSVCGGKTGQVHVFTINQDSLTKAELIGFTQVAKTPNGVKKVDCKTLTGKQKML